ncbi:hypothetical protein B566_EDAN015543 [Ephemera danica]|nr:hypothetical protein B566_EDAN015543 [Ephemera danica]
MPVFRLASEFSERAAVQDRHGEYSYRGLLLSSNQLASQVASTLGRPAPGLRIAFLCPNNATYVIAQWATWIGGHTGVVLTHSNLHHQASSLSQAWDITAKDVVLHTLPLHHMHGIVNGLLCPLYVGAKCVMMPQFDSSVVWKHLLAIKVPAKDRINIFMAVPTMYLKLLQEYDDIFSKNERMKEYVRAACQKNVRLMISGSASLPAPVFEKWEEATGHRLLERYGMSEVGMALSNPLRGERRPGFVGYPLPHIQVRLAQIAPGKNEYQTLAEGNSHSTRILQPGKQEVEGELLIRGPTVFRCYWNKPKATAKEFTTDGWFRTGDTVQYVEGKGYRIVGRTSVDIIKTGGYKVGALEVETHLLTHPNIMDCAVVGVPDITWGQKDHMAPYAIPTLLRCVDRLPKNSMGKVNKKELISTLFPESSQQSHAP